MIAQGIWLVAVVALTLLDHSALGLLNANKTILGHDIVGKTVWHHGLCPDGPLGSFHDVSYLWGANGYCLDEYTEPNTGVTFHKHCNAYPLKGGDKIKSPFLESAGGSRVPCAVSNEGIIDDRVPNMTYVTSRKKNSKCRRHWFYAGTEGGRIIDGCAVSNDLSFAFCSTRKWFWWKSGRREQGYEKCTTVEIPSILLNDDLNDAKEIQKARARIRTVFGEHRRARRPCRTGITGSGPGR